MALLKKAMLGGGAGPSSYAPIAQALNTLTEQERGVLHRKFDFVAVENLPLLSIRRYVSSMASKLAMCTPMIMLVRRW